MSEVQYNFDFAEYPESVLEIRSTIEEDPAIWSCRDILIRALRQIDSGEISPETMVICHAKYIDGSSITGFFNKSACVHQSAGLLHEVLHLMIKED